MRCFRIIRSSPFSTLCAGLVLALICSPIRSNAGDKSSKSTDAGRADAPKQSTARPEPVSSSAIENLFRLTPGVYSGGEPRGEAAFQQLQQLGVRTIISVDGATPEVEAARKQGIRYVHLPIGYDGVPAGTTVQLAKAVQELPGPVFVHCHHGKHRGPAAAAICGMAGARWSPEQAIAWMKQAGTDPQYRGLYDSVRSFRVPSPEELRKTAADYPERAQVSTLVEAMVRIDARWDRLKEARAAGWPAAKKGESELSAAQEALQLAEQFRELARAGTVLPKDEMFRQYLRESSAAADAFHAALSALETEPAERHRKRRDAEFTRVGRLCRECHQQFRDAANAP